MTRVPNLTNDLIKRVEQVVTEMNSFTHSDLKFFFLLLKFNFKIIYSFYKRSIFFSKLLLQCN